MHSGLSSTAAAHAAPLHRFLPLSAGRRLVDDVPVAADPQGGEQENDYVEYHHRDPQLHPTGGKLVLLETLRPKYAAGW